MSVVIGIGLLGTTQAFADPVAVTSGHITAMINGGTFALRGEGFELFGSPQSGYASGLWDCAPCRAGDRLNLSLSSSADGFFEDGLPGEFDHVQYDATWLAGVLRFTAGDVSSAVLDEGQTALSVPFTFYGEITNYDSYAHLSAALDGSAITPVFFASFTGSGIATAHFRGPVADPDGALFFADHISYDFTSGPASPTPEPASLLLLGTGAAGLLARRRVRADARGLIPPT